MAGAAATGSVAGVGARADSDVTSGCISAGTSITGAGSRVEIGSSTAGDAVVVEAVGSTAGVDVPVSEIASVLVEIPATCPVVLVVVPAEEAGEGGLDGKLIFAYLVASG